MVCQNCGVQNPDGVTVCTNCGAVIAPANTYNQPYYGAPAAMPGKGLAIASLVLGIISFFLFPIVTGLLAIILGSVAKNKGCTSGMATGGIACGIIGLALWLIMIIFVGSTFSLF